MQRPSLKSALLITLLIAGMATQWMTNAVARASNAASGIAMGQVADPSAGFLVDLVQSVCSGESGKTAHGDTPDCYCQYCVPAAHDLTFDLGGQIAAPLALAFEAGPWPASLVRPTSRRLLGDGPSRAPPAPA